MYILGISCFYHDSAAALIKDGKLIAAAEEERFSRIKHDFNFPSKSIRFCLEHAGISEKDLEYTVFYEKPFHKFERILMSSMQMFPRSWKVFREAMMAWLGEKLWVKSIIKDKVGIEADRILFGEHHLSHAASAFYPSPFDEAAFLTVDGVGEWATTTMGIGRNTEIKIQKEIKFPHSLGLLYSAFTAFLGFRVNNGEYKVMGMAPYGKPIYIDKIYNNLVKLAEDGSFRINMDIILMKRHSIPGLLTCLENPENGNPLFLHREQDILLILALNLQISRNSAARTNITRTSQQAFKRLQKKSC